MYTLFQYQLLPKSTVWYVRWSVWHQQYPKSNSPLGGKEKVLCSRPGFIFFDLLRKQHFLLCMDAESLRGWVYPRIVDPEQCACSPYRRLGVKDSSYSLGVGMERVRCFCAWFCSLQRPPLLSGVPQPFLPLLRLQDIHPGG